jgi:hypothetical protein
VDLMMNLYLNICDLKVKIYRDCSKITGHKTWVSQKHIREEIEMASHKSFLLPCELVCLKALHC